MQHKAKTEHFMLHRLLNTLQRPPGSRLRRAEQNGHKPLFRKEGSDEAYTTVKDEKGWCPELPADARKY